MTDEDAMYSLLITAVRVAVELRYGECDLVSSRTTESGKEVFVFEPLDREIIVTVVVGHDGKYQTYEG